MRPALAVIMAATLFTATPGRLEVRAEPPALPSSCKGRL